ncbi:hypothetical protein C2G38_2109009, partial [Gigaspora rosea]
SIYEIKKKNHLNSYVLTVYNISFIYMKRCNMFICYGAFDALIKKLLSCQYTKDSYTYNS